ncbi:UDP-3-O-(3-hydroxymyristoyl)glucosamine N-acyltransferase [filamentous cyanobacterium LEGE 11480]|uniref:UDP-3-O-acylglucosamine N-acyltransferase n=1 Tax=Romeriopsis navalis LEGE 11480 TaxID=2777977 RepID=A0A928Z1N2_9CYAN|nr:UDP-3-O-(3-hydroxymyristoyl)glucosamine N-acyltransferase [Romeriopsis navalis]MBE9029521.1 UDP-3-O-(3-hydroxymyristoyl)glucosamine N-acyltransferase [Romeriopsis navalis LEGE 11480]
MRFAALVEQLQASQSWGDGDLEIQGIAAIDSASPGTLSYADSDRFSAQIQATQASALILPKNAALQQLATAQGIAWIESAYPRLTFAQALDVFYQPHQPAAQIHPTAVIDPTAKLGANVAVGAHTVIAANVVIGDGVAIWPNVVIYPEAQIGDRTLLHANCVIQERSQIGTDCVINSGSIVGGEGFGYVPTEQGWYKMQQSGYVVLEDRVEIGCNCTIDRPAVGETRLGHDTILDNMVHIGHGCTIGFGCAMASQAALAGGVVVGNRVIIAGQVGVANNVKLRDGSTVSSRSGVHHDTKPGQTVSGYPAVDHSIYLKSSAIYKRLPEMYQTLRRIKRHLGLD